MEEAMVEAVAAAVSSVDTEAAAEDEPGAAAADGARERKARANRRDRIPPALAPEPRGNGGNDDDDDDDDEDDEKDDGMDCARV